MRLAQRNIWRQKRRSAVTLSAIALGIWSAVSLSALARGVSNQLVEDGIKNFLGHLQIHRPGYLDDPSVDYSFDPSSPALLSALNGPDIKQWAQRVRVPAVVSSERESGGVTLIGIDPPHERGLSFIMDAPIEGRFIESSEDSGLVIGAKLAELLKTGVGKRVVLASQGFSENGDSAVADRGFRIVGLFRAELETTEKGYAFTGIQTAQDMLGLGNKITEISATTPFHRDAIDRVVSMLQPLATNLEVKPWYQIEPMLRALLKVQGGFLYIWFAIVIAVICFGLINTLFMGVLERVREFGLVQAIGMRPGMIRWQVLWESLLLLATGAALGTLLAFGTVELLADGIDLRAFASGTQFVGVGSIIYPVIRIADILFINILVFVLGLLSSLLPAARASALSPAQAFRSA